MTDIIKLLTGEAVYEVLIGPTGKPWDNLGEYRQNFYSEIAKKLNQRLGICESCGACPADGKLYEITDEMWCSSCLNPPMPAGTQWIWPLFNADGEIVDSVVLPDGMTLEDYQKQLKEEMSHIHFMLTCETVDGQLLNDTCTTLPTLSELINKRVAIGTPDRKYAYTVQIFKDSERIGYGAYNRTWDSIQIVEEMNAAKGLSDMLYELDFKRSQADKTEQLKEQMSQYSFLLRVKQQRTREAVYEEYPAKNLYELLAQMVVHIPHPVDVERIAYVIYVYNQEGEQVGRGLYHCNNHTPVVVDGEIGAAKNLHVLIGTQNQ